MNSIPESQGMEPLHIGEELISEGEDLVGMRTFQADEGANHQYHLVFEATRRANRTLAGSLIGLFLPEEVSGVARPLQGVCF